MSASWRRDRKFIDQDLREDPGLVDLATEYAMGYRGEFPFMVDLSERLRAGGDMTIGMARGALNCARMDPRWEQRLVDHVADPWTEPVDVGPVHPPRLAVVPDLEDVMGPALDASGEIPGVSSPVQVLKPRRRVQRQHAPLRPAPETVPRLVGPLRATVKAPYVVSGNLQSQVFHLLDAENTQVWWRYKLHDLDGPAWKMTDSVIEIQVTSLCGYRGSRWVQPLLYFEPPEGLRHCIRCWHLD